MRIRNTVLYGAFCSLLLMTGLARQAAAQAPSSLQYPAANIFTTNLDQVYLAPTVAGNVTGYSIYPTSLPAGISFNTTTGVISGLPTAAIPATTYTVTAFNGGGFTTSTQVSLLVYDHYYDNNNGQISFLGANAVPKVYTSLATAGTRTGDVMLYQNVRSFGNVSIDCIVKTTAVNNMTFTAYDQNAATDNSSYSNNDPKFFSPMMYSSNGSTAGSVAYEFQFILGGSYNAATQSGTKVVLRNVKLNTYDIDGDGGSKQYNEFSGFSASEVGNPTSIASSLNNVSGLTRFASTISTNVGDVVSPKTRVRVSYDNMSSFSIVVGTNGPGTAYFFLDFSFGVNSFLTAVATPAPALDLDADLVGVNRGDHGCGSAMDFTGGSTETNAMSGTPLDSLTLRFTAQLPNGGSEKLLINGTATTTIPLNFSNTTTIGNLTVDGQQYSVTPRVENGFRYLTFRSSTSGGTIALAKMEKLVDAMQYRNDASPTINGDRNFTVNIYNTKFKSPDAVFTADVNCVSIGGHIYHDANGMTDNTVNATGASQFADNSFYAVLVRVSNNTVLASQPITNSSYNFGTVAPGKYYLYFKHGSAPANNSSFTASTYPAGYTATGENLGAGAGTDGNTDGRLILTVGTQVITEANFGLQMPPLTAGTSYTIADPGGFNNFPIPAGGFNATDADGSISKITITGFPGGANYLKVGSTYYTNGGNSTCPPEVANCTAWPGTLDVPFTNGNPSVIVAVDPKDNGNGNVSIPFKAYDNAGAVSNNSTVALDFNKSGQTLSGNVWIDRNGNGMPDLGEALTSIAGTGKFLYAALIQHTNTYTGAPTVLATERVNVVNGYSFSDVPVGNNYSVRISTMTPGQLPAPGVLATNLPVGLAPNHKAVSTNNSGTYTTGLNTEAPVISVTGFNASRTNVNFGLDQPPVSNNASHLIPAPALNSSKALTAANGMSALAGTDPEEGSIGSGSKVIIKSLAGMNGNTLKYNGTTLSANSVISNYDPGKLTVQFSSMQSTASSFTYVFADEANLESNSAATYNISWSTPLPVTLVSFDAAAAGSKVELSWESASESKLEGYGVQRSADGKTWETIATTAATGDGRYQQTDAQPLSGSNYYRLQMTDLDGTITYSGVRKVSFDATGTASITAFPNPATDRLNIESSDRTSGRVLLVNATGATVLQAGLLDGRSSLDLSGLPAGTYFVQVAAEGARPVAIRITKR